MKVTLLTRKQAVTLATKYGLGESLAILLMVGSTGDAATGQHQVLISMPMAPPYAQVISAEIRSKEGVQTERFNIAL